MRTAGDSYSNDGAYAASIQAAVDRVFGEQDRDRDAWLVRFLAAHGTCKVCGARLSDRSMEHHPGLCALHARPRKTTRRKNHKE